MAWEITGNSRAGLKKAVGIYAGVQTFPEQDKELIKLETIVML